MISISFDIYEKNWNLEDIKNIKKEIDIIIENFKNEKVYIDIINPDSIYFEKGDCFGGIYSFTISPTGEIYPCTFSLNKKEFLLGNVKTKEYNRNKMLCIFRDEINKIDVCKDCKIRRICKNSMCRIINKLVNNNYNIPTLTYCIAAYLETYVKEKYEV